MTSDTKGKKAPSEEGAQLGGGSIFGALGFAPTIINVETRPFEYNADGFTN